MAKTKLEEKRDIIKQLFDEHAKISYVKKKVDQKNVFYIDRTPQIDNFNYIYVNFEIIVMIDREDEFNKRFDKEFNRKAKLLGFAITNKDYLAEQEEGYITLHTFIK